MKESIGKGARPRTLREDDTREELGGVTRVGGFGLFVQVKRGRTRNYRIAKDKRDVMRDWIYGSYRAAPKKSREIEKVVLVAS
ncbi:MAG: hypothetical protein BMS9Abin37_1191 [Acidobacteriota bacterium]|nr:MAG: hypothetical protein BMS9Abin37_1191 [Acidobacteriota bacterium]